MLIAYSQDSTSNIRVTHITLLTEKDSTSFFGLKGIKLHKVECYYLNNNLHGPYWVFDKNNIIRYEAYFEHGIMQPEVRIYDAKHRLRNILYYSTAEQVTVHFYNRGKLLKSVEYKNDLLDGEYILYNKRGQILTYRIYRKNIPITLIYYKKGKISSIDEDWDYLDEKGNFGQHIIFDKNGNPKIHYYKKK
jgi:antitoxin component YwqK of YwqJK toxin-antitoxin module